MKFLGKFHQKVYLCQSMLYEEILSAENLQLICDSWSSACGTFVVVWINKSYSWNEVKDLLWLQARYWISNQLVRSWDLWEQRFSQCCLLAEVLCYKYLGRQWRLRDLEPENRRIFSSQATHISRLLKIETQIVHSWSIWELYFISIYTVLDILG